MFGIFSDNDREEYLSTLSKCGIPVCGHYWWTRYPKRAVEEIEGMLEHSKAVLDCRGNRLIWEESIVNNFGRVFVFSIEAGGNYPFTAPKVFLKEPYITPSDGKHIYGDSSLCLFRPEAYSSRMRILNIRHIACSWCFCIDAYERTGEWPGAEAVH